MKRAHEKGENKKIDWPDLRSGVCFRKTSVVSRMRNQGRKNGPGRLMRRRRSPEEKSTSKRSTKRALAVWKKRVCWKADSFESVYFFSLSVFPFQSLCF